MNPIKTCFARFSLALALALGMVSVPSASAEAAAPPCPRVVFLGLHGLNEGKEGGKADKDYWGTTVDSTWRNFVAHYGKQPNPAKVQGRSVSYPRLTVSLKNAFTRGNVFKVNDSTTKAAGVLKVQIKDIRGKCGAKTAIVLAGYSQGAWVVDRTVRLLGKSSIMADRLALRSVVGVFLMGDPAWPLTKVGRLTRAGIATWFGLGYREEKDYLTNELSKDEFQSICLGLSNGRIDPVCMGLKNNPIAWQLDIGVHGMYVDTGVTRRGGDFLYPLAQKHRT